MSTAPAVRRPSAVRRWGVRFLVVAAIGVFSIGSFFGWQIYRRFADQRVLQDTIADLDARHPRWRLKDLEADRAVVPDDENSASIIRAAAARIPPFVPPDPAQWPAQWVDWYPKPSGPAVALTDEEIRSVIDLLESCESAIGPAQRLERFPRGRHEIARSANGISTLLPHAEDVSKIQFRVLRPLLLLHLHEGDGEAAVRDCICTLHLAQSMENEPDFISQTSRYSIVARAVEDMHRVLGQATVTDADLARLQLELAAEAARDGWPLYLRGDRAAAHRVMAAVARGDVKVSSLRNRPTIVRLNQSWRDDVAEWFDDRYPPRLNEAHAWLLTERTRLLDETASSRGTSAPPQSRPSMQTRRRARNWPDIGRTRDRCSLTFSTIRPSSVAR